jgi:hypothetical protein
VFKIFNLYFSKMSFEEEKSKQEGTADDRAFITSLVDPTDAK